MRFLGAALLIGAGLVAPAPSWSPCSSDTSAECTTISVPLDYADRGGTRVSLAVSRIRTAKPDLRRGVLVLIPGGPGGSGLGRPSAYVNKLPQSVLDRYDLVSFDPRGVGASSPISCELAAADVTQSHLMPWPGAGGDISGNVAWAQRVAADCEANGGPVYDSISSRTEALDLDAIRQALGEKRISYWAVSYGTYVGAVYATLFPSHTDRVVLDSNDDPDPALVERGWAANYALGAEDRFPDFAAWARTQGLFGPDPRTTYLSLAARLDAAPLPWPGADPPVFDGNALRAAMLTALYSDASFPGVAALMSAALAGGPMPAGSAAPEAALQNTVAVINATLCHDVGWPHDVASYASAVAADRVAHPLTAGMPVDIYTCAFTSPPSEAPVRVTSNGPSNVLLIQNLRDPATPYAKALNLRKALGDRARLVSVDAGGHGSYLANGNACGDATVTTFLSSGTRPAQDVTCP